ncbi:VOC family protein [Haloferax sp. MBLA0076]|uniref:VOC family protein n=1 Tax=Haloferax litoreum TaxID=2666140 RepID=A0A6A8GG69_9EURY|nr:MULTISPECIES: VOC family protein [Haloferax]KAB1192691.1 VOC family protein [Haloferax sp. CBA1148]MRX21167.1 VOC family protein [Haloferax litoreum]
MAINGVHHVVLRVPDVPDGEACYRELFDMEVRFREGLLDGDVGTVPEMFTWDDARSKGVTPTMSFLGRDEFFLAVAQRDETDGKRRVDHIALAVDESTFESVTERAEAAGCTVERNAAHHRTFEDPLGFEWELNASSPPPSRAFDTLEL